MQMSMHQRVHHRGRRRHPHPYDSDNMPEDRPSCCSACCHGRGQRLVQTTVTACERGDQVEQDIEVVIKTIVKAPARLCIPLM
jgi:hypothetical protein